MKKNPVYALRPGDMVVFSILLLLSAAILGISIYQGTKPGRIAHINIGGETVTSIDLTKIKQPQEFAFTSRGYHITVGVEPGRICVLHSDCPDQVCVRTGWLSAPGKVSACVPAGIVVSVSGEVQSEMDVILQ